MAFVRRYPHADSYPREAERANWQANMIEAQAKHDLAKHGKQEGRSRDADLLFHTSVEASKAAPPAIRDSRRRSVGSRLQPHVTQVVIQRYTDAVGAAQQERHATTDIRLALGSGRIFPTGYCHWSGCTHVRDRRKLVSLKLGCSSAQCLIAGTTAPSCLARGATAAKTTGRPTMLRSVTRPLLHTHTSNRTVALRRGAGET
jgi:hypothetical protein